MQLITWKEYLKPLLKVDIPFKKDAKLYVIGTDNFIPNAGAVVMNRNVQCGAIVLPGIWDGETMTTTLAKKFQICFHPEVEKQCIQQASKSSTELTVALFPYNKDVWPIYLYFYWCYEQHDGVELLIPREGMAGIPIKENIVTFTLGE